MELDKIGFQHSKDERARASKPHSPTAAMRGDIHLTPTARMDVDGGRPSTRSLTSSASAMKKTAAFTTSPMSVLLQPLTPASAVSFASPGGSPETRRRILSDEDDECDEDDEGRVRRGEPQTPRSGNEKTKSASVFAEELDRAAREPWAAPVGGAFDTAPESAGPPSLDRRRTKTRSADLDALGFDFCGEEGRADAEDEPMFRVFGRDIGKPPMGSGGRLFGSFGRVKGEEINRERHDGVGGSGSEGRALKHVGSGGGGSSSFGSQRGGSDEFALSRMNSLAETKVLTSTHLVRQTSLSNDVMFDFDEHFRFEQRIAFSQNSEVWLVTSKTSGQAFVVKKCLHSFTTNAQRDKYKREVEAAALLPEHPNIVRYYRSWQKEQFFYIQMEHCACGSFASVCSRLPPGTLIAERDVWRLALQIADGLAFMHAHNVLHLDIKPDNIYVDINGDCKIGDLGLAYVQGAGWDWEEGDGGYVAPELLNLFPGESPMPSADVFSLGVTLYEAATGMKLPRGATPRSALPPLPEGRSAELARLIEACLVMKPTERATASEIARYAREVLEAFGDDEDAMQ